MNILEASQELLNWFSKNDSFSIKTNFSAITKKSNLSPIEEAAINLALSELEKIEFVSKYHVGEECLWILKRPLNLLSQNVEISGMVALHVSNVINNFFSLSEEKDNLCDSTNISEADIMKLVEICSFLAKNLSEQEKVKTKK